MTHYAAMLALVFTYKFYAQIAALLVTAAVAFRRGAGPEKACAAIMVIVLWFGDLANHTLARSGPRFTSIETGHLVLDAIAFVLFLVVALYANRIYPIWMSVTQGVVLLTHFAEEAARSAPLAYSILSMAPSYLLLGLLIGGVAAHLRRVRRYGRYRSWRMSASPVPSAGSPPP